jgi:hypothetical protein
MVTWVSAVGGESAIGVSEAARLLHEACLLCCCYAVRTLSSDNDDRSTLTNPPMFPFHLAGHSRAAAIELQLSPFIMTGLHLEEPRLIPVI